MLNSCYYDVEEELYYEIEEELYQDVLENIADCDTLMVQYTLNILPIIDQHCFPCHSLETAFANVVVEPYNGLKNYVDNGELLCVLNHQSGCSPMPKNAAKLTDCELAKIEKWIDDGAQNN